MLVVCKLPFMLKHIDSPGKKFFGLKILVLVAPNQLKIILSLMSGGEHGDQAGKSAIVGSLGLSKERAYLLHSSLLFYECLFVVIFNFLFWRPWEMRTFKRFKTQLLA